MKILALDPATKCGWAHSGGSSGTWDLSIRTDESGGMRLIRLEGKLVTIHNSVGIDVVVYEAARHAGPNMGRALVVQAEMQGVIKLWCDVRDIPYRGFSPSEIKKHATGRGNANKIQMMDAAFAKGWRPNDDNEADAMWLLDLFKADMAMA